ncbi:organic cation transporter protein-like isoform X2 [Bacillus rossius redtenbacheri]|uniref:organic cation transporter protein-like isoform X2 n=1 Tax=Bacillus rossius redtenbacheri TaxID=93214 RepID=UPI002FDEC1AB
MSSMSFDFLLKGKDGAAEPADRAFIYDEVFKYLGEFGRYQKRLYFMLCLPAVVSALHKLGSVFLQAKAAHRCRLPWEDEHAGYALPDHVANMSYPWDPQEGGWSSCLLLDANLTGGSRACSAWVFDQTLYGSSTVMEFDLVCSRSWIPATTDAVFMSGDLIGSTLFGYFSDKFGRRPIFFFTLTMQTICGIAAAAMPNAVGFMITRFLIGLTASALYVAAYVLAMELVGPSKRMFAAMIYAYFFTAGYVLCAFFSYFLNNWRYLQLALTAPGLILFSYWWCLPESTRWLLSNRRKVAAKRILLKVADVNRVQIPDKVLENMRVSVDALSEGQSPHSVLDLVRVRSVRARTLVICFNWFVISCTYFGLSWSSASLGGNDYVNFLMSGLVELPAPVFLIFTLDRCGRKPIFTGCMLVAAAVLLLSNAIPADLNWLRIALIMVGKMAITAAFNVAYILAAELFPTVLRNVGIGTCSTCARVGGIAAPYVIYSANVWQPFPEVIFGLITMAGGLLGLMLPETLNRKLPDTVEECENYEKKTDLRLQPAIDRDGTRETQLS